MTPRRLVTWTPLQFKRAEDRILAKFWLHLPVPFKANARRYGR